jgi:hypothetical protein
MQLRRSSLTPAQGFLPWGTSRLTSSFTLKELRNRIELFQSYEIAEGGLSQGSNPGLKLANTFGVKSRP